VRLPVNAARPKAGAASSLSSTGGERAARQRPPARRRDAAVAPTTRDMLAESDAVWQAAENGILQPAVGVRTAKGGLQGGARGGVQNNFSSRGRQLSGKHRAGASVAADSTAAAAPAALLDTLERARLEAVAGPGQLRAVPRSAGLREDSSGRQPALRPPSGGGGGGEDVRPSRAQSRGSGGGHSGPQPGGGGAVREGGYGHSNSHRETPGGQAGAAQARSAASSSGPQPRLPGHGSHSGPQPRLPAGGGHSGPQPPLGRSASGGMPGEERLPRGTSTDYAADRLHHGSGGSGQHAEPVGTTLGLDMKALAQMERAVGLSGHVSGGQISTGHISGGLERPGGALGSGGFAGAGASGASSGRELRRPPSGGRSAHAKVMMWDDSTPEAPPHPVTLPGASAAQSAEMSAAATTGGNRMSHEISAPGAPTCCDRPVQLYSFQQTAQLCSWHSL